MDNESCYAAIRLTQKGQPTQNVPLTYPRKKFDPRKITHAKLSVKRTHDQRKFTHDPRKVTHVPRPTTHDPRPTTHDPRSFFNPRNPRNPRNLAHSLKERLYIPYLFYVVQPLSTTYDETLCLDHIEGQFVFIKPRLKVSKILVDAFFNKWMDFKVNERLVSSACMLNLNVSERRVFLIFEPSSLEPSSLELSSLRFILRASNP